jgi:hypothetical protein
LPNIHRVEFSVKDVKNEIPGIICFQ